MATIKKMKKAQEGAELRRGQYKRIGRIAENNPDRAERVAERMTTKASRVDRGKEIAGGESGKKAANWLMHSLGESRMEAKSKTDSDRKKYDLDIYKFNSDKQLWDSNKKDFPKLMKQKSGGKTKMKNGGSLTGLKAGTKRVGPVDPKGAYTKVQKKTLAGAKGKASLIKDKQLGATKMKMGGKSKKH
jgi:hypothetical protein